jgi:BlaI family transcriptional regulator, penicillinase repressor
MDKLSLTPCEAEVMNVVWCRESVTVQDVVDSIPRDLAYTTVMTTIRILEEKGFVSRTGKRGRALVYSPIVSCESVSRNSLSDTANRFFDGSLKSMVLSLIKTKQITADDLAELRAVIDSIGE